MQGPIHLVLGDHGAERLGDACLRHGLPGTVHCIADDLGHGPLDDGVSRVDYMRACYRGFDDWQHSGLDAFESWAALERDLRREPRTLVVWAGRNVSEGVLLAMACFWLRGVEGEIAHVEVPEVAGRTHTGTRTGLELAGLYPRQRVLPVSERAALAVSFERLRDDGGLCRRWKHGHIVSVPLDEFDQLLIDAATIAWQPATQVVGLAMQNADPRDGLSDMFLTCRLQALLAEGRLQPDRAPRRLHEYQVRLAWSDSRVA